MYNQDHYRQAAIKEWDPVIDIWHYTQQGTVYYIKERGGQVRESYIVSGHMGDKKFGTG